MPSNQMKNLGQADTCTISSNGDSSINNITRRARIQQAREHKYTKLEAIKAYPKCFGWMALMVWCMILLGYENQASGIVIAIPQFRKDFGHSYGDGSDYVLDTDWQSALTGGSMAAMAIASVGSSVLADRVGRKWVLCGAVICTIPFIAIEFISTEIAVFFAGKTLNAFCLGVIQNVAVSYASEISPLSLRGFVAAACNLSICIGPFVCYLINNTTSSYTTRMSYRAVFIPQWIFSLSALSFLIFLPESPYFLIGKGKREKALTSLTRLYGPAQAENQYALMKETVDELMEISSSSKHIDCFKKDDLKRTLLVIFTFIIQPFAGLTFISSYSTYYYQLAGFSTHRSYQLSIGAQAMSITGAVTSWFIIDRFGRRATMLWGLFSVSTLNMIVAGSGLDTSNMRAMTVASAFMSMYNFFYNSAIGPLPFVIGSEVSSVSLRAKTMGFANNINYLFQCMWSFVLPYMFNPDRANMGSKVMFIFAVCGYLFLFVVYFYMPETAHRSFEEIDEMFAAKVPARRWKTYVTDKQNLNESAYNSSRMIDDEKAKVEHIEEEGV